VYDHFNFIGRDKENFYLQHVALDDKGMIKINYNDKELTGLTTKEEFVKIFGEKAKEHFDKFPNQDTLILYSKANDGGGRFTFKNGRLSSWEYWTPC